MTQFKFWGTHTEDIPVTVVSREGKKLTKEEAKEVADFAINTQSVYGADVDLIEMADESENEEIKKLLDKVEDIKVDWPDMPDQSGFVIRGADGEDKCPDCEAQLDFDRGTCEDYGQESTVSCPKCGYHNKV